MLSVSQVINHVSTYVYRFKLPVRNLHMHMHFYHEYTHLYIYRYRRVLRSYLLRIYEIYSIRLHFSKGIIWKTHIPFLKRMRPYMAFVTVCILMLSRWLSVHCFTVSNKWKANKKIHFNQSLQTKAIEEYLEHEKLAQFSVINIFFSCHTDGLHIDKYTTKLIFIQLTYFKKTNEKIREAEYSTARVSPSIALKFHYLSFWHVKIDIFMIF